MADLTWHNSDQSIELNAKLKLNSQQKLDRLSQVGLAPFETPGTDEFAKSMTPFVQQTNAFLLANHDQSNYRKRRAGR